MPRYIIFTGGSGKAGKDVIEHLLGHGYEILNVDTKKLNNPKVRTLNADVTDSGQMFNALTIFGGLNELEVSLQPKPVEAVVHFAAIPRIMDVPDNELFRINTLGTYNVIEAAAKLGVKKIVIASSETTYGLAFATEQRDPEYFPLDEDYPIDPMDSYALSKVCNERTAQAFALRFGIDIYALRIGNVIEPHEYARFPGFFEDASTRKRMAWSYIDTRDLGQCVRRALETDGLGYQAFNVAQDDCSSNLPTAQLLRTYYPGVRVKGELGEFETLLSIRKAKAMLGYQPEHSWRRYVPDV
jgi:nucleoside-diphosphate-sugar epimerase